MCLSKSTFILKKTHSICVWNTKIYNFKISVLKNSVGKIFPYMRKLMLVLLKFYEKACAWHKWANKTCAYQGVKNVRFSENLACRLFLKHSFWDWPFCLITDELQEKNDSVKSNYLRSDNEPVISQHEIEN